MNDLIQGFLWNFLKFPQILHAPFDVRCVCVVFKAILA